MNRYDIFLAEIKCPRLNIARIRGEKSFIAASDLGYLVDAILPPAIYFHPPLG